MSDLAQRVALVSLRRLPASWTNKEKLSDEKPPNDIRAHVRARALDTRRVRPVRPRTTIESPAPAGEPAGHPHGDDRRDGLNDRLSPPVGARPHALGRRVGGEDRRDLEG